MKLEDIKLGIIGLGYVGLPLAVEFSRVRPVVGFDISADRIKELQNGVDSTLEISSDDLRNLSDLSFSDNFKDLENCNCFIVTVPTPIDDLNEPDLRPLLKASEMIGRIITYGDMVIYESTVYPGATEEECAPVIERFSSLTFNKDFFLYIF